MMIITKPQNRYFVTILLWIARTYAAWMLNQDFQREIFFRSLLASARQRELIKANLSWHIFFKSPCAYKEKPKIPSRSIGVNWKWIKEWKQQWWDFISVFIWFVKNAVFVRAETLDFYEKIVKIIAAWIHKSGFARCNYLLPSHVKNSRNKKKGSKEKEKLWGFLSNRQHSLRLPLSHQAFNQNFNKSTLNVRQAMWPREILEYSLLCSSA